MHAARHYFGRQKVWTSLLLLVLLVRAYIPVGFMPADGAPFQLQLCPATSPVPMSAHHHHSDTHSHFEHCPFGSAPAAGPLSQIVAFASPPAVVAAPPAPFDVPVFTVQLPRAHQPRGPPVTTFI